MMKIPQLRPLLALEMRLRHKRVWLISLIPWQISYFSARLSQLDSWTRKGKWRSDRAAEASIDMHLI